MMLYLHVHDICNFRLFMLVLTDHMEELVSGLQGPPGLPGRGRPGRPGPPGRIGHTGTGVDVCFVGLLACLV